MEQLEPQQIACFREKELEQRIERLKTAVPQELKVRETPAETPHVVYVMRQVEPYGGTKIILEHANRLTEHGFKVTLVSHFPEPGWFSIRCGYVEVPFDREVAEGIPDCDVIVATSWNHINACIETGIAPVVFFEQGGSHLFDWDRMPEHKKKILKKMLSLPRFIITVSQNAGARMLKKVYNRDDVTVFHNALDENVFYPGGKLPELSQKTYIMTVGSEKDGFKRVGDVVKAFELVRDRGYDIDLVRVTKDKPEYPMGRVFINPPQKTIGDLYRSAAIYVSASLCESFSMPVLEAMACGCPVVTTANSGVMEYAEDGYNCLLAEMNNPASVAEQVIRLLDNPSLRLKLRENGIKTAGKFKWDRIIPELADYYRGVAMFEPV